MRHTLTAFLLIWPLCLSGFSLPAVQDSAWTDTSANNGGNIDISKLTRDDVLKMSKQDLLNLSFKDLIALADKYGISVSDLLNTKVSVSSKKAVSTRESPGIITVVTDEEIANSGARDLIDVLRLVPGFEFGSDVEGATSVGIRGIWAEEGKWLLLIDGQEMNELSYSSMPIGSRIDVSQIKRIEILRGPGSCIYGGFAELSVINIITKKSDDINGGAAQVTLGQMPDAMGRTNGTLEIGNFFKGGDYSVKVFGSTANRSDRNYGNTSDQGDYVFTTKNSGLAGISSNDDPMRINAGNINASASLGSLSARVMYDYYQTGIPENSFDSLSGVMSGIAYPNKFRSYFGELKYEWQPSEKLTITPKFNYKGQSSWESDDPLYLYNVFVSRYTGNVLAIYDVNSQLNILGGLESYFDDALQHYSSNGGTFSNGKTEIGYHNYAAFVQGLLKTRLTNFIVGGRADYNDAFGSAFSPRIGVTGIIDKFNYKAILSRAFRAPGIENIREGDAIKPEKTTDFEVELGYIIGENMFLTANIFDIAIKDPIIYSSDNATGAEQYKNYGTTGSAGFELDYKTNYRWGYTSVNYSYTNPALFNSNSVPLYRVPGHDDLMLGFPQDKFTINIAWNLGPLCIDPSFCFLSTRYAYDSTGASGIIYTTPVKPRYLCNLFFRYKDLFAKGLDAGAGVYDLLNRPYEFIQPFQGEKPMLGPSREFIVRLSYRFKL